MNDITLLRIAYLILWISYHVGTTIYFAIKMVHRKPNPEGGEKSALLESGKTSAHGTVVSIRCGDRCCVGPIFLSSKPYITTNTFITWYIVANTTLAAIFGVGFYFMLFKYF
jgi:hypothetical protein